MKAQAILTLALFSLSLFPCSARAQESAGRSAEEAFRLGMAFYQELDYERAVQALEESLQGEGLDRTKRIRALSCLAVIYVGMNRNEEAIERLVLLLKTDPDVKLDYDLRSPKVMEALHDAREIYMREIRATDTGAPVIQISPVAGKVLFGKRLDMTLRISDKNRIVESQIFFRRKGDLTYDFLPIQHQGSDVWFVSIPSQAMTGEAVEYYVVAIDEAGNASIEGSVGMPVSISVASNPEDRPWYKKWWVWTGVAVVAGGAAAAGVLLSSGDDKPVNTNTGSATITFGP